MQELPKNRKPQGGYGLQFYPGTADAQSASAFQLRAGANVHVTHTFIKQRLFQVSGTVHGVLPDSSLDVNLTDSLGERAPANPQFDPKTGDFQIPGIPAGIYQLTAVQFHAQSSAGVVTDPPLIATQTLHVDRDLTGVGSGISIPVQVRDDFSHAANEAHQVNVVLVAKDSGLNVAVVTVPPRPEDRRASNKLENLSPGTYWVEAQPGFPQDYVGELRCGSLDLLREVLVIAPGASVPSIDVTLRNDVAQLSVTLKQKGRSAAVVIYSRDYPRRSLLMPFPSGSESISATNLPWRSC